MSRIRIFILDKWIIHQHCLVTELFSKAKHRSAVCPSVLTYLLHGAESSLRSKLVLQLVKKFPALYGTRKFITVFTSARHLSLS